ncbi:MAG: hypothetical protein IT286_03825 [Proteobacteria bacterium]|nr:hypothetical protein [Pseudomonadota bacterium]
MSCPASGATSNPLVRKICQVANSVVAATRTELINQLQQFVSQMQSEINHINTDISDLKDQSADLNGRLEDVEYLIDDIDDRISALESALTALEGRMTSAEAAIDALELLTAGLANDIADLQAAIDEIMDILDSLDINGGIPGGIENILIGYDNPTAGPFFELVTARLDRTRIDGLVTEIGAWVNTNASPLSNYQNPQNIVRIAINAHSFVVGDRVELSGFTFADYSTNLPSNALNGKVLEVIAINANWIEVNLGITGSYWMNGPNGGNAGQVRRHGGSGMSTLWSSGNASDTAVRVTTAGAKPINFIIRRQASDATNATFELCYSRTVLLETFSNINAASEGGSGNIVCK